MSQFEHRRREAPRFPFAAIALVLVVGYLVMDRLGVFSPAPRGEPRPVVARGDLSGNEKTAIEIFESNSPSVVHLTLQVTRGSSRFDVGTGSGFVWDEAGHIVTNHHVIEGAIVTRERIEVRMANRKDYTAFVVGSDPDRDIAVLKFASNVSGLRPVPIGTSKDLKVGQSVFAIGNPFGLDLTLTGGLVSALGRSIATDGGVPLHDLIQTDAAINPGNSGGPLFDSAGRLIGMNTAIFSKTESNIGIGFAVPVDVINRVVPSLIAGKSTERAILGVNLDHRSVRLPESTGLAYGVPIGSVAPGYGAEEAGLRPLIGASGWSFPGDAIVAIEDTVVESASEAINALRGRNPGDRVRVRIARFASDSASPEIREVEVVLKAAN